MCACVCLVVVVHEGWQGGMALRKVTDEALALVLALWTTSHMSGMSKRGWGRWGTEKPLPTNGCPSFGKSLWLP